MPHDSLYPPLPPYNIPRAPRHFKGRYCRVISMIGTIALYGRHCSIPLMPWQTLQHDSVCCSPLRHTPVFKGRCCRVIIMIIMMPLASNDTATHCDTLQHTATHCNIWQHTATYCNTHHYGRSDRTPWQTLQHTDTATHCNTLQHIATHCNTSHAHCNTWQHMATQCNAVQHTATHHTYTAAYRHCNTSSCVAVLYDTLPCCSATYLMGSHRWHAWIRI